MVLTRIFHFVFLVLLFQGFFKFLWISHSKDWKHEDEQMQMTMAFGYPVAKDCWKKDDVGEYPKSRGPSKHWKFVSAALDIDYEERKVILGKERWTTEP